MCLKMDSYPNLKTEVPGLKLVFLKKKLTKLTNKVMQISSRFPSKIQSILSKIKFSSIISYLNDFLVILDNLKMIFYYFKQIEVLQVYHLLWRSLWIGLLYRIVNEKGVLYLKLDEDPGIIEKYQKSPNSFYKIKTLNNYFMRLADFDLISIETMKLYHFLRTQHPLLKNFSEKIFYSPSGFDKLALEKARPTDSIIEQKSNIILHVGRIGTLQKRTDIILNAFTSLCELYPSWKLIIIGASEKEFVTQLENGIANHPHQIIYAGFISDRNTLYDYYKQAKLIAIPSSYESFGLVAVEAGFFETVVVGSDIPSLREITNDGQFGFLSPPNDLSSFTYSLEYALNHPDEITKKAQDFRKYLNLEYDWSKICEKLVERIEELKQNKQGQKTVN